MAVLKDFTKFMLAPVAEAFFFSEKSWAYSLQKYLKKNVKDVSP